MDESLMHYGVLGMKWRNHIYADRRRDNAPTQKRIKDMTDDELRTKITRWNLEKQYRTLRKEEMERNRSTASKMFEKYITKPVEAAASDLITKKVRAQATELMERGLEAAQNRARNRR